MTKKEKVVITLAILGVVGMLVAAPFISLAFKRYFAPAHEQVRRDVYETSIAFNAGKIEQIGRLCYDLSKANAGQATALQGMIRTEVAAYDTSKLPSHLQPCVTDALR